MKSQAIVSILCLCLGSCLDFGEDLELSGGQVSDKELSEVTRRTGIDFPEGAIGLGYLFLGSGIDDALALKATIPDDKRLDFLKNEIFTKGDTNKKTANALSTDRQGPSLVETRRTKRKSGPKNGSPRRQIRRMRPGRRKRANGPSIFPGCQPGS